jgi:hypothetical protein
MRTRHAAPEPRGVRPRRVGALKVALGDASGAAGHFFRALFLGRTPGPPAAVLFEEFDAGPAVSSRNRPLQSEQSMPPQKRPATRRG